MKIVLSPIASDHTTQVSVNGLIINVDGTNYDLSVIPEGGQAEGAEPFVGIVTRNKVTIQYHYNSFAAEDDQSKDWSDYTFNNPQGKVPSPIKWKPDPIATEQTDEVEDV